MNKRQHYIGKGTTDQTMAEAVLLILEACSSIEEAREKLNDAGYLGTVADITDHGHGSYTVNIQNANRTGRAIVTTDIYIMPNHRRVTSAGFGKRQHH